MYQHKSLQSSILSNALEGLNWRILSKLGVSDRTQAAIVALKRDLVTL